MRQYLRQTHRERLGAIDGLNLFFGALLGANLGTVEQLPLYSYVQVILLLAGTVMALRITSTSERRGYALFTIGLYVILVGYFLVGPARPEGLTDTATERLGATLAIWVTAVLVFEFWPTKQESVTPAAAQAPEEAAAPPPR